VPSLIVQVAAPIILIEEGRLKNSWLVNEKLPTIRTVVTGHGLSRTDHPYIYAGILTRPDLGLPPWDKMGEDGDTEFWRVGLVRIPSYFAKKQLDWRCMESL